MAGNTKRSAERVSASRNRGSLSFTSIACSIPTPWGSRIAVDRRKLTDPQIFQRAMRRVRDSKTDIRDTSWCLDESQNHCFVLISHLSGQNGTYDAQATLTLSTGFLNLTHRPFCLG